MYKFNISGPETDSDVGDHGRREVQQLLRQRAVLHDTGPHLPR